MPDPIDKKLYNAIKVKAASIYDKPSAYKSGYIVKEYKKAGGRYADDGKPKKLAQWYKESWHDVGNKSYPVYRPSKRVNESTPLTVDEIDKDDLRKQINRKQIIKGDSNLKPFKSKNET